MRSDDPLFFDSSGAKSSESSADWAATKGRIRAVSTTRRGGVSQAPFDTFNLGRHVGDDPGAVRQNRNRLLEVAGQDIEFCWLSQVHGTDVTNARDVAESTEPIDADACVSTTPGLACAILSADCLPVIFCDRNTTAVAAAHAGWRGLSAGILESTMASMPAAASELFAWLGPAIGPDVFEVGPEVVDAFVDGDEGAQSCFRPSPFHPEDRWVGDLYELARRRLAAQGMDSESIYGGKACTYTDEDRFFSYRRDGQTGRMATAIWILPDDS